MRKSEIWVDLKLNTAAIRQDSKVLEAAFGTVRRAAQNLGTALTDAFSVKGYTGYVEAVGEFGKELANQLLCLQFNFGRLKAAIIDAATPVARVFVPMLNQAIAAVTAFVRDAGQVLGALLGGNDALADSTDAAAQSQKKLAGSVSATGKAVKKTLAGFDEINRLNGASGGVGASGGAILSAGKVEDTLSPRLQSIVDKIQAILEPLRSIDLTALCNSLAGLREALEPFREDLVAGLKWAYENLFVPLARWTVEDMLPVFLQVLSRALGVLRETVDALKPLAVWLWESFLQPIAQWTGGMIVDTLQWLAEKLEGVSGWIRDNQPAVEKITIAIGAAAAAIGVVNSVLDLWNGLSLSGAASMAAFGVALSALTSPISLVVAGITAVISVIGSMIRNWDSMSAKARESWLAIQNVWGDAGGWLTERVLNPIGNGFKNMVNGVIGFINAMIRGIVSGINAVVNAVNKISFTLPSWVPGIGGKSLGFQLKTVNAPQIPYLAKGAVLPANKPFLAMVGDQKHGTNVEAPLETIQEAVAVVMEDMVKSNIAGHEATVAVLREILGAVLGIEIGDSVIGESALRYQRHLAATRGG